MDSTRVVVLCRVLLTWSNFGRSWKRRMVACDHDLESGWMGETQNDVALAFISQKLARSPAGLQLKDECDESEVDIKSQSLASS